MKTLRSLSLFYTLLVFFAVHAAKAQVSVYGTVSETAFGYNYDDNTYDYGTNGYNPGIGGGVTYVFVDRAVTVGLDIRDTFTPTDRGGDTGAASIRLGFVPKEYTCHPYFQIGPGFITTKTPVTYGVGTQTLTTAAVALAWGLDVRVAPNLDIRAIEIGLSVGNKNSSTEESASFSAGVVYHFPGPKKQTP